MTDLYVKKLEDENAKLYMERSRLFSIIKSVSVSNNINVEFAHIAQSVTPDMIFNYVLKNYKHIENKSGFAHTYRVELSSGKYYQFVLSLADPASLVDHNRMLVALALFRVIWDDYNAKTGNRNSFGLLLDIIKDEYI